MATIFSIGSRVQTLDRWGRDCAARTLLFRRHCEDLRVVRIERISSLELPELAPYRTLKRSATHATLGIFVAEGDKVLDRLLASNFTVVSVLLIEERLAEYEPRLQARPENITVFVCVKPVLAELAGFEIYQGVLAIAKTPPPLTLDKILADSTHPQFFVAMDGLSNSENVGTLMRNCVAFGVSALISGETCCSPFLRRTVRNSMGALFKLPVLESANLVQTLCALRAKGIKCIAAHPRPAGKNLSQADFTGDVCVVFGSEGHGISQDILSVCDDAVAIPMANNVNSLNVSAAAAVFFYEANRQRGNS